MKTGVLIIIALILSIQGAFAITTDLKDSYLQKETVVTEIRGNILGAVDSSNVELRRGHILVPVEFEVKKLGEDYFLWFITPESEQNYTLNIKNIPSTISGQIGEVNYTKNFSVLGNLSAYSIKPGFVYSERDFEININLNEDNDREISVKFLGEESENTTLKPGENILSLSIKEVNETGFYNLSIDDYNIPVYVKLNKTVHRIFVNESEEAQNLTNENASKLIENISEEINITGDEGSAIDEERARYHCYEFPGKICAANQACSGQTIVSADGACCVNGDCTSGSGEGGSYAWIGYLIGALVIIGGIFVYLRYKKIKEEKNPIAKKVEQIERKMP